MSVHTQWDVKVRKSYIETIQVNATDAGDAATNAILQDNITEVISVQWHNPEAGEGEEHF